MAMVCFKWDMGCVVLRGLWGNKSYMWCHVGAFDLKALRAGCKPAAE
jgi:hypothetical protein